MTSTLSTPAINAAEAAQRRIESCICAKQHFLVEAGAGAGKTHSLVKALTYLIQSRGRELRRSHQQIACITYTNVAAEEIRTRIDKSPLVACSTIHSFCWTLIREYQPAIRQMLPELSKWAERISESGEIGSKPIEYNLGYPKIEPDRVLLQHNDVLQIMVRMLEHSKFRDRLAAQFPVLFIDEYQDTDKELAMALKRLILDTNASPLIGLFGDSWQRIYPTGCGEIRSENLQIVNKGANFRSVPAIVKVLNRIRHQLPQEVNDPSAPGTAQVFHTNDWPGQRRSDARWAGDLPPDSAEEHLKYLRVRLEGEGWNFDATKTKILMLTNRVLAQHQGYGDIAEVFGQAEAYVQKTDPYMAFLLDVVEPMCKAYEHRRFGEMFAVPGASSPGITSPADKARWTQDMAALLSARKDGTVGDVIDVLARTERPPLPEDVARRERLLASGHKSVLGDEGGFDVELLRKLRLIPYIQIGALSRFVQAETPFETTHGVKGAEFENVLVVVGRGGWGLYNFEKYLVWAAADADVPAADVGAYERNRNLFYVACSRPERRLAILFIQHLSDLALGTLNRWFGESEVRSLTVPGPSRSGSGAAS